MLVLTRKVGESVEMEGGEFDGFVEVKEIRRNQVRIGFEFPEDVEIHREEIAEKIRAEEQDADGGGDDSPKSGERSGDVQTATCSVCGGERSADTLRSGVCRSCNDRISEDLL